MAYIGFYLTMIGLAAAGEALEIGSSLIGAIAMTVGGAALMWLYREEGDSEGESDSADSGGSCSVDKSSGEGRGGCVEDIQRRDGRNISNSDNSILPWDSHSNGTSHKAGHLRCTGGMDRQDGDGMGI